MGFFDRLIEQQAEGKALLPNRFFASDAPLSTYVPGPANKRTRGVLSQREARQHLQAYGGSEAIDWVMDCVGLYADTAANAPWHFEKKGKALVAERQEDTPPDVDVADEMATELFRRPNPFMDYVELIELLVIDLLLVGNAYWYKYRMAEDGKPLAIYRLSPSDVRVQPGPQGAEKYIYAPGGTDKKLEIDPFELIHFKRPNPHNPYYGLGVIKGGGRPYDLELALTDSQAHYFENKADPSVIVQSERRVPRDVFNKLRAQLRARASGRQNTGELLVLEAGLKAMTLQPTARDAMFRELADASRDRICAMFRVSPKLLGLSEVGAAGDKVQDARREFDNKTIRPFLDKLQTKISWELAAAWGYDFVIDYDYVMPQEELVKLAGDFASIPGVKVKEVRAFLKSVGLEPSTGDPTIDEIVLNIPGEELGDDGQPVEGEEGFADQPLPREAGRPPKGENTRVFPRNGGALPAGSRARRPRGKALNSLDEIQQRLRLLEDRKALKFEEPARTTIGNKLPDEERPDDTLSPVREREIDAIADDMSSDILDAIHVLERGLLDHVEGKAFDPDTLTKRIRNSASWKTFSNLLTNILERGATQAVSSAAVHQGNEGRLPENELDYEAIAKSVVHRPTGVRGIVQNMKDRVLEAVGKKVKADGTKEEVDRVVREAIDEWRQTRAENVALTEAVEAYNEGTLVVLESLGYADVVVFDGEDHDDACREANGQVWSIEQARENRLEHPRCRRAFAPAGA